MKIADRQYLRLLVACAVGLPPLMLSIAGARADDTMRKQGKAVAEAHCSRCHVVGKHNLMGGISSTPSFSILVNGLSDWHERFSSFYSRLPHPSVIRMEGEEPPANHLPTTHPIYLKIEQIDAIIAFVATLKK